MLILARITFGGWQKTLVPAGIKFGAQAQN